MKPDWADRSTATPETVAENVRELLRSDGRPVASCGDDLKDLRKYLWDTMDGVALMIAEAKAGAVGIADIAVRTAVDLRIISSIAPWCLDLQLTRSQQESR